MFATSSFESEYCLLLQPLFMWYLPLPLPPLMLSPRDTLYLGKGSSLQLIKIRRGKKALVGFTVLFFFSPKYLERFAVVVDF